MENKHICSHDCRNVCSVLIEVLKLETDLAKLYNESAKNCIDPEVRELLSTLKKSREGITDTIMAKLNEMNARAQIDDELNLAL